MSAFSRVALAYATVGILRCPLRPSIRARETVMKKNPPKRSLDGAPSRVLYNRFLFSGRVVGFDVVVENLDELGYDLVAFEGGEETAIHVDGGFRFFGGPRERNSEACMLRFSGTVDDTAHHGNFHFF